MHQYTLSVYKGTIVTWVLWAVAGIVALYAVAGIVSWRNMLGHRREEERRLSEWLAKMRS